MIQILARIFDIRGILFLLIFRICQRRYTRHPRKILSALCLLRLLQLFLLMIEKKHVEILVDYRGGALKFTKNSLEGKKISKNEFFSLVAETILGNYYASLYESTITGIIRKPKIKKQLKALGKKNISYAKKFLNNIEHMIRTEHEHYQYCTKFPVESYTKLS